MEEKLKELMQELGNAINESLSDSDRIAAAIGEIKRAAIDDGKDIHDHPAADLPADRPGRLHKALDLLRKVHADLNREEDDPMTRGLKDRALRHVDEALHATERALGDARA